jgi:hypothetical protein
MGVHSSIRAIRAIRGSPKKQKRPAGFFQQGALNELKLNSVPNYSFSVPVRSLAVGLPSVSPGLNPTVP